MAKKVKDIIQDKQHEEIESSAPVGASQKLRSVPVKNFDCFAVGECCDIELKKYQSIFLSGGKEVQSKKFNIEVMRVDSKFGYINCKINAYFKGGMLNSCEKDNIVMAFLFKDIVCVKQTIQEYSI